jgi:hypothetical protein
MVIDYIEIASNIAKAADGDPNKLTDKGKRAMTKLMEWIENDKRRE